MRVRQQETNTIWQPKPQHTDERCRGELLARPLLQLQMRLRATEGLCLRALRGLAPTSYIYGENCRGDSVSRPHSIPTDAWIALENAANATLFCSTGQALLGSFVAKIVGATYQVARR